jgi:hypothetical protein
MVMSSAGWHSEQSTMKHQPDYDEEAKDYDLE